jgi:hypothetical protein
MKYGTGAKESPYDLRTFAYVPTGVPNTGGVRYTQKDIEHQHKVGICTAISLTQNARKARHIRYSADFQYLLQKKFLDKNWDEGSSIFHALKAARTYGLLPEKYWKHTTLEDRKRPYSAYVKKLQAVSDTEIERLLKLAERHKITAFSKVPVDRDFMAQAIIESEAGLLTRYVIGKEWWRQPIEPLKPAKDPISGHAVIESNFDGDSFRIANTWGSDWATNGTAYRLHSNYRPTEAWLVHYGEAPETVQQQLDARNTNLAKVVDILQQVIVLYKELIKRT